jgi:hypothetical protein
MSHLCQEMIYPASVTEVLDPPIRFRAATIAAVRRFARSNPWRGTVEERKSKVQLLHDDLCRVYQKRTQLDFDMLEDGCSGASSYCILSDTITLRGRISFVTYAHEFAHALGRDEFGAVRWSVNLFRRCFPRSFSRCVSAGHMLRRSDDSTS